MEEQSGWLFDHSDDGDGTITVLCTKEDGSQSPVRFVYTANTDFRKKQVTLYTQFRTLDTEQRFASWDTVFSYKASVRLSEVLPWVAQQRQAHGAKAKAQGLKSVLGELALTYALPLVWAGIKQGMALSHENKSLAKDRLSNLPDELF
jgi:hypothetical protein